jgi:hypothetical protein
LPRCGYPRPLPRVFRLRAPLIWRRTMPPGIGRRPPVFA